MWLHIINIVNFAILRLNECRVFEVFQQFFLFSFIFPDNSLINFVRYYCNVIRLGIPSLKEGYASTCLIILYAYHISGTHFRRDVNAIVQLESTPTSCPWGPIGKVVGRFSAMAEAAPIYTMHEALSGYCS